MSPFGSIFHDQTNQIILFWLLSISYRLLIATCNVIIDLCIGLLIIRGSVWVVRVTSAQAMTAYYRFVMICLIVSTTYANGLQTINGRIKITIGTTSGCIDTVNFISNQLVPTYQLYREFLDLEFVPWGRTIWNGTGFYCLFGENDCWANRLQRCVLNMLSGNQEAQFNYMRCEFSIPYPSYLQGSYYCADFAGLSIVDVDYCVANPGDELDNAAQAAATEPMKIINFVPSITFNDVSDVKNHNEARQRLASLICFALADDPTTSITSCLI